MAYLHSMLIYNSSNVSSSSPDSKTFVFRLSSIRRRQLLIYGSVKGRSGCLLDVKQAESVCCNTLGTISWSRHAEDTASGFCSWPTMLMIRQNCS
jgi:hypothetical protein